MFVNIERMTLVESKNGGKNLTIRYSFAESPFGNVIIASTDKGICYMAFEEDENKAPDLLKQQFPNSKLQRGSDVMQEQALSIFQKEQTGLLKIKLHLRGTDFQIRVWEELLKIPVGKLTTYGNIAEQIHHPKACRAVGTAIGSNPVAMIIPCHRVVQASGKIGGYRWGSTRKTAIIGWEAS